MDSRPWNLCARAFQTFSHATSGKHKTDAVKPPDCIDVIADFETKTFVDHPDEPELVRHVSQQINIGANYLQQRIHRRQSAPVRHVLSEKHSPCGLNFPVFLRYVELNFN